MRILIVGIVSFLLGGASIGGAIAASGPGQQAFGPGEVKSYTASADAIEAGEPFMRTKCSNKGRTVTLFTGRTQRSNC